MDLTDTLVSTLIAGASIGFSGLVYALKILWTRITEDIKETKEALKDCRKAKKECEDDRKDLRNEVIRLKRKSEARDEK